MSSTSEYKEIDIIELSRQVWRKKKNIAKFGLLGMAAGFIIAISIPKEFSTTVKLAPESGKGIQLGSMSSLAAMAGINIATSPSIDGITSSVYPDIVKSKPFLLEFSDIQVKPAKSTESVTLMQYLEEYQKSPWWNKIIGAPFKLLAWIRSSDKQEPYLMADGNESVFHLSKEYFDFVEGLEKRINVQIDKKTDIISASVRMQDPVVSAIVADSLIHKLEKYMILYKTNKTRNDLNNSVKQYNEAKKKYYEAEEKLAEITDRNRNIISESRRIFLDRLQNERDLAFEIYRSTAQQVELNKIKLQEETPITTVIEPAIVPRIAAAPRKIMIIFSWTFLGVCLAIGIIVVKNVFGKSAVNS